MADATVIKLRKARAAKEPQYRSIGAWSPARVETAKKLADLGNFEYAAELAEKIFGDDRALSPLQALAGIAGLDVTFETEATKAGEEDPQVEALERDWWHLLTEETQGEILRWASVLGFCWVQIKGWELDEESGRLLPKLDVWHQKNFRWDDRQRTWKVKRESGHWDDIEAGNGQWLLFTPYGRKRPHAKAPWYSLGMLWLGTQYAKLGLFEFNDTHAQPLRIAHQQPTSGDGLGSLPSDEDVQELTDRIAAIVRGGTLALPLGYKLDLLQASGNADSFFRLIDDVWPKAVSIALTGNNLTTQIDGGSFAASQTAAGVSLDRRRTFARCLETTAREQLLVWWSEFNFGNRLAPWPHYQVAPPPNLQEEAARLSSLGAAVQALTSANVPLSPEELKRLGVPVDLDKAAEERQAQLFQYHLLYGIVTVNEARKQLGLDPVPGGDTPPANPYGGGDGGGGAGDGGARAMLATRLRAATTKAESLDVIRDHIQQTRATKADDEADDFDDELIDRATKAAGEAVGLEDIMAIIESVDEDDPEPQARLELIRREVLHRYASLDPAAFADAVERTEMLASMNGRYAALRGL